MALRALRSFFFMARRGERHRGRIEAIPGYAAFKGAEALNATEAKGTSQKPPVRNCCWKTSCSARIGFHLIARMWDMPGQRSSSRTSQVSSRSGTARTLAGPTNRVHACFPGIGQVRRRELRRRALVVGGSQRSRRRRKSRSSVVLSSSVSSARDSPMTVANVNLCPENPAANTMWSSRSIMKCSSGVMVWRHT